MRPRGFFAGFGICVAVFVGVLGALQLNGWIDHRQEPRVTSIFTQTPDVRPVADDGQIGSMPDFRAAAHKVMPSVVSVDKYERVMQGFFEETESVQETSQGSGVIISSDGLIVTNNHVVENAEQVKVRTANQKTYTAKVLGRDPRSDLAVIKIDAQGLQPAEIASSSGLQVGQWAIAVGNPLGFDDTVSVGVVSSLKRSLQVGNGFLIDAIQTDAAINPGNSGGALTDAAGKLIGINSAIASGTGQSVGIGFAIPIDRVKEVTGDIVKFGYARYAGLGVGSNPSWHDVLADPQVREQLAQLTNASDIPDHGMIVNSVDEDGPAEKAGLHQWDVIFSVDDHPVNDVNSLNQVLTPMKPKQSVMVKFWDSGQVKTVSVTLEELRQTV
jgi:S1-C subfamily serine protease